MKLLIEKYIVVQIPSHNDKLPEPVSIDEVLYSCTRPDYGDASYDTELFRTPHISVTRKSDGDYPYVTMPVSCLKHIETIIHDTDSPLLN